MKGLGYSLNQIFFVIPESEKGEIFIKGIKPAEWIDKKRKEYGTFKEIKKTDISI